MSDRPLAANHLEVIRASAISDQVREARGYWTAATKRELRDLGFTERQQQVPALVLPVWSVHGQVAWSQIRPDHPRSADDGHPIKYDTPRKARMILDVPPTIRHLLSDPRLPLFVTEGIRKADSAASIGLCCVDVIGVWSWRGANLNGGTVALPDLEFVAVNLRDTYIAFDSDIMVKPNVHEAMRRFKAMLESRQAKVHLVYLPAGEHGAKVGLDDYIAAGHSLDDLLALATDELRRPESRRPGAQVWHLGDYEMVASEGIFRHDQQGARHQLTDFAAFIHRKTIEDDGVEERQRYELEVQQGEQIESVSVLATEFESLRWLRRLHRLDPYIAAGNAIRDHARAAIDLASRGVSERAHVYTHLGWREVAGQYVYLHAGGAIGADGSVAGVEVELSSDLARFRLPDPPLGDANQPAIRASLDLLKVAPDRIMVPLLSAVYRAVLGYMDNGLYLVGRTGVFKSELTALAQQHWGPELTREHLPGSWGSTANALRAQLFLCKDAVLVVDDFAPGGGRVDRESWERKAAEILRAQGNAAGRGRADTSGGLRPIKPPRALLATSGEDLPAGHSIRARNVILEIAEGDVNVDHLTEAQRAGAAGLYAQALAGYLRWLAPRLGEVQAELPGRNSSLRDQLRAAHRRTPTAVAQLAVGWHYFLEYADAVNALEAGEHDGLWQRGWLAFKELTGAQDQHQAEAEPTARYLDLLAGAIASGAAHVADTRGRVPSDPAAWGWRWRVFGDTSEWQPQGPRVGWIEAPEWTEADDDLYLLPEAAYKAAQSMTGDGTGVGVGQKTLSKRLKERGLLVTVGTGKRQPAVSHRVEGVPRYVLHVRAGALMAYTPPGSTTSTTATTEGPSQASPSSPVVDSGSRSEVGTHANRLLESTTPSSKGGQGVDVVGIVDSDGDIDVEGSRARRQHEGVIHHGQPVEWRPGRSDPGGCLLCHPQPKGQTCSICGTPIQTHGYRSRNALPLRCASCLEVSASAPAS